MRSGASRTVGWDERERIPAGFRFAQPSLLLLAGVTALLATGARGQEMRPDAETQASQAAAAAPAKPRPAMLAPLAAKTTLLGLAQAGERVVAVGQRGHILLSGDGKQWQQVDVPLNAMLNRVRFRDATAGWAVGHDATILATADGGTTWTLQHHDPEGKALYDLLVLDERRLIAVGAYGTYLVSNDGGSTWEPRSFPLTELGQHFNAIARLADGSLFMTGERGLMARSKDAGESWDLLDSPYTGSFFGAVPAGPKGAMVFGLRGNLYIADDVAACPKLDPSTYDPFTRETTPDEGAFAKTKWRPVKRPTLEGLFGGSTDGARATLVGVNGVVVGVDLATRTAQLLPVKAPETLNDVLPFGGRWLAVGRRGVQDLGPLTATGAQ
jgi:photosystem II stability/assembly factor-like uncharacterized protein